MRFIYTDEAGISDGLKKDSTEMQEPVIVVVGIILHADKHWKLALQKIQEVVKTLPEKYRAPGFFFHATQIWNSHDLREEWDQDQRARFLCDMMSIPRLIGIDIAVSFERKEMVPPPSARELASLTQRKLPDDLARLVRVYSRCMSVADQWMQKYVPAEEVAVLVAEEVTKAGLAIKEFTDLLKIVALLVPSPPQKETEELRRRSMKIITPISIRKIVDTVHFVAKGQAPLTQIADACAFGLKRFYAKQPYGDQFASAILGPNIDLKDADTGISHEWTVFMPNGEPATIA